MKDNLVIPISPGELIDKITILEIKRESILDKEKLSNINLEYMVLLETLENKIIASNEIDSLRIKLKTINKKLWDIEDQLRDLERSKTFNEDFIKLARSVYFTNDERSEIKKSINKLLNSEIVEEKSYSKY